MWIATRALALLLAISAPGCEGTILIDSVPRGALVIVDGVPEGETPIEIEIIRNQFVRSYDLRLGAGRLRDARARPDAREQPDHGLEVAHRGHDSPDATPRTTLSAS